MVGGHRERGDGGWTQRRGEKAVENIHRGRSSSPKDICELTERRKKQRDLREFSMIRVCVEEKEVRLWAGRGDSLATERLSCKSIGENASWQRKKGRRRKEVRHISRLDAIDHLSISKIIEHGDDSTKSELRNPIKVNSLE
jgi:hypothetical protein